MIRTAGISIRDPDNEELELGKMHEYHNSGAHKVRLRKKGDLSAEVDEKFDPKGWVTLRKTDLELLEDPCAAKSLSGPQCFLKFKKELFFFLFYVFPCFL